MIHSPCSMCMLCGISTDFPVLSPSLRQVAHVLLTRPPLRFLQHSILYFHLEYSVPKKSPFDLHVLSTPPAFVLSQDQTLKLIFINAAGKYVRRISHLQVNMLCPFILLPRSSTIGLPDSKEFFFALSKKSCDSSLQALHMVVIYTV